MLREPGLDVRDDPSITLPPAAGRLAIRLPNSHYRLTSSGGMRALRDCVRRAGAGRSKPPPPLHVEGQMKIGPAATLCDLMRSLYAWAAPASLRSIPSRRLVRPPPFATAGSPNRGAARPDDHYCVTSTTMAETAQLSLENSDLAPSAITPSCGNA